MKTIRVVVAVIRKDNKVLATQRAYGEFKGGWEFPGGKIEENESPKEALIREIKEELNAEIQVGDLIETVEYDYPTFHLSMDCFWCSLLSETIELLEHQAAKWIEINELERLDWLPADIGLVETIKRM